eukprot:292577_1
MSDVEAANTESFEIYIQNLTGKTIILYTKHDDTILNLKEKIFEKEGIHPKQQRLIYNSQNLSDNNATTIDCKISSGSTINLVIRLGANDIKIVQKGDEKKDEKIEENWYYLESTNEWKPFNKFISLMLSYRYNQKKKYRNIT